jgi:hypothetical protein
MVDFMKRSQALLEELFPCVVVVDGEEIAAASGRVRKASEYEVGGEVPSWELRIRILMTRLKGEPEVGMRMEYREPDGAEPVEVRVLEVARDEVAWVLRCGSVDEV